MRISKFIKKLFIVFIALLIGNISLFADANQLKTIQHKQRVTHEKIKRLKVLENKKKNKLYKNDKLNYDNCVKSTKPVYCTNNIFNYLNNRKDDYSCLL